MHISLVYPEVYDIARFKEQRKEFPPFGILYLAASLEQAGIEVEIHRISPGNTHLDLSHSDVVGFSIPSSATLGLVRDSRRESFLSENAIVLVGGVHANLFPVETFTLLEPDVVSVGEGEEAILEIIQACRTGSLSDIRGIVYRDACGIRETEKRPVTLDISKLPLPARHLLPEADVVMTDRLSNTDLRMAHVMFSRGCPYPCRFCAVAQTTMQYRSGESARAELVHLKEKNRIDGFAIVDDNFIVNKKKVREICGSIQDLDLKWSALSRVDTVDADLLTIMRDSGCIEIKYGMESGSQAILDAMKKKITPDHIRRAVQTTFDLGIKVKLFIIHGYPGETLATTRETKALLEELAPMVERVSLFRFVPLPGTHVYTHAEELHIRGTDKDPDWDGDWSKYHIHHNDIHWWGDENDFAQVCAGFKELNDYIGLTWPQDAAKSTDTSTTI